MNSIEGEGGTDPTGEGTAPEYEKREDEEPGAARALVVLGAYVMFRWIAALVRLPPRTPGWVLALAFVVTAAASIGLPIWGTAALVRFRTSRPGLMIAGVVALGAALAFGLQPRFFHGYPAAAGLLGGLQDLGKILAAAGVGLALASALREPNILVPAGAFAAFADFVVVKFGTVKHALSTAKGQALVQAVSAKVPSVHASLPSLTIGPADFLFLGVFLACAARFDLGLKRNAWALALVLAVSLVAVPVLGAVPALAPMAVTFLVVNWKRFRLSRQEVLGSVLVLVVAGALFLGYFLLVFPTRR